MYPHFSAFDTAFTGHDLPDQNFKIFTGKPRTCGDPDSKKLPVQFLIYDTLVCGIDSAAKHKDFRGVMGIGYTLQGENFKIIFAMWFSSREHMYFLTSLGQFSANLLRKDLANFKAKNRKSFHIQLHPIDPAGLENLAAKLHCSNLSRANVCIMQNTVAWPPTIDLSPE